MFKLLQARLSVSGCLACAVERLDARPPSGGSVVPDLSQIPGLNEEGEMVSRPWRPRELCERHDGRLYDVRPGYCTNRFPIEAFGTMPWSISFLPSRELPVRSHFS
jgi:hypothetical protein